jgi:hypothetical protein
MATKSARAAGGKTKVSQAAASIGNDLSKFSKHLCGGDTDAPLVTHTNGLPKSLKIALILVATTNPFPQGFPNYLARGSILAARHRLSQGGGHLGRHCHGHSLNVRHG